MAGKSAFPSMLLPDKQTSKWKFVLAAPLLPLLHTSCDSPNHSPWAVREVPVHVSARAGPLSQGKQGSQRIKQTSSKVPVTWPPARSSFLLSFFISSTHSVHSPKKGWGQRQLGWNGYTMASKWKEDKNQVITRQYWKLPFQAHQFTPEIVLDKAVGSYCHVRSHVTGPSHSETKTWT